MKKERTQQAVTAILGTVMLMGMALSLFAMLNILVFSIPFHPASPSVSLIGWINESDYIHIEHNGGEPLPPETKVYITIGTTRYNRTIEAEQILFDTTKPGELNFGETLLISPLTAPSEYQNSNIAIVIVDPESNSIVMSGSLQKVMN
jgi:hypothetical protein